MVWPFRRARGDGVPTDAELLSSSSVWHLKTMPESDVVLGTMFTDPLAPPEEDPEAFYAATPEATPRRLRAPGAAPLDLGAFQRLRTAMLEKLDPRNHQRTWMAVHRCESWDGLRQLLGEELQTTDGATLTVTWPEPSRIVVIWSHPSTNQSRRVQFVRDVHW